MNPTTHATLKIAQIFSVPSPDVAQRLSSSIAAEKMLKGYHTPFYWCLASNGVWELCLKPATGQILINVTNGQVEMSVTRLFKAYTANQLKQALLLRTQLDERIPSVAKNFSTRIEEHTWPVPKVVLIGIQDNMTSFRFCQYYYSVLNTANAYANLLIEAADRIPIVNGATIDKSWIDELSK